jgi:putative spermidine/putrescine transport system permease protein
MSPWKFLYWVFCAAILVYLIAPILVVIPLSFTSGNLVSYPLQGFSLRWYEEVLLGDKWMRAIANSLLVGVLSTILSVVLGTLAALGLAQSRSSWASAIKMLFIAPMIVPVILIAVSCYFFMAPLGLTNSYLGLVLGHTIIAVPFVVLPVLTALELLDPNLSRAAASCGAPPRHAFISITMPVIMPAIASGALFAFATSFDDVVVALFIAGPEQRTLPKELFTAMRSPMTPAYTAVATVMIVFSTTLFILMQRLQRRAKVRPKNTFN